MAQVELHGEIIIEALSGMSGNSKVQSLDALL